MSHPSTAPNHSRGTDLLFWRRLVFGIIGIVYLLSLFNASLRDALGKLFAYFPH